MNVCEEGSANGDDVYNLIGQQEEGDFLCGMLAQPFHEALKEMASGKIILTRKENLGRNVLLQRTFNCIIEDALH